MLLNEKLPYLTLHHLCRYQCQKINSFTPNADMLIMKWKNTHFFFFFSSSFPYENVLLVPPPPCNLFSKKKRPLPPPHHHHTLGKHCIVSANLHINNSGIFHKKQVYRLSLAFAIFFNVVTCTLTRGNRNCWLPFFFFSIQRGALLLY